MSSYSDEDDNEEVNGVVVNPLVEDDTNTSLEDLEDTDSMIEDRRRRSKR